MESYSKYLFIVFLLSTVYCKSCGPDPFTELLKLSPGLEFEEYDVKTEDDYTLKLFRIRQSDYNQSSLPIFLQHGILDSADNWVINGAERSLGLRLAALGYDVFLGNNRGNKYSLTHGDKTRREFWDFSFQEMGQYDVPANIDTILKLTGHQKLIYIGHSQGTTQMFAALTDEKTTEYVNSRVAKFIALAPVVYLSNEGSRPIRDLNLIAPLIEKSSSLLGIYEILPGACSDQSVEAETNSVLCHYMPQLCDTLLSVFIDKNPIYDNEADMPKFVKHVPSGTSIRCLIHYHQIMNTPKKNPVFKKFDFGLINNLKKYGSANPPVYDFANVKIPVRGFVGLDDDLGDYKDNSILRNNLLLEKVDYKEYVYENNGHMTFMWGLNPSAQFSDIIAEVEESK